MSDNWMIVGKLQELLLDIKKTKEESDAKAREWAVAYTKLQDVLAWVKTYCVDEEEE